jgi:hypothetical protein
MTGNERELRTRQLAVEDVKVGAADTAGRDAEKHLTRPWLGDGNVFQPKRLASRVKHHRAHE